MPTSAVTDPSPTNPRQERFRLRLPAAPPPRADTVLVIGLVVMIGLMLFITVLGLQRLTATEERLERIVANNMAKIRLASRMHNAARERTVSLQKMILLSDPFDRDAERIRIYEYGGEFAAARERLLAMDLTSAEQELLGEQARLTRIAVPLQERIVEMVARDETSSAHQLLVEKAIPAQDQVLARLQAMYALQEQSATEAAQAALASGVQARLWMLMLSGGALGLGIAIAFHVVRRTRRTEGSLRQEKERAQVTLHSIGDAVIRTDRDTRVEYMNPVAERLTRWNGQSARGQLLARVLNLRNDADAASTDNPIDRALQEDQIVTSSRDLVLQAGANVEYAIELTAAPIHDDEGQIAGAVLVFRDVTEMRTLARELGYQATHDPLTGLLNRREFEHHLQRLLDKARTSQQTHALCYIDLDLFKVVNDTCGHIAGDELLRQLGHVLRTRMRKSDVLARLGGDEFGVLLENCALEEAERVVNELHSAIREFRFIWENKSFEVAASVGLTPMTAASGSLYDLLRIADLACYAAKDAGRNRVHVARQHDLALAERQSEVDWVQRIKQALLEGRLTLHCQRIQALSRGAAQERYEILVRLIDDNGDLVYPRTFLPVAERYQLMPALDRWVFRRALELLKGIQAAGTTKAIGFNINLSGQSLGDVSFREFLIGEISASGLPPHCICFEITETATVANLSSATQLLVALKDIGCQFALDDFGSGLSSFAYLKNLPVDYLKIDGAFIRDVLHDRSDHAMVASIHQLAHILGIKTIAEYVESREILAAVERIGIDYGQGYAIAQPEPLEDTLVALTQVGERTGTA